MGNIGQLAKFQLKSTVKAVGSGGRKFPVRFDGFYNVPEAGLHNEPAISGMAGGIPGVIAHESSGLGKAVTNHGFKLQGVPRPDVYEALRAKPPVPDVDPIVRDMRVQHLRKAFGL